MIQNALDGSLHRHTEVTKLNDAKIVNPKHRLKEAGKNSWLMFILCLSVLGIAVYAIYLGQAWVGDVSVAAAMGSPLLESLLNTQKKPTTKNE